jgi:peroxiredoxin
METKKIVLGSVILVVLVSILFLSQNGQEIPSTLEKDVGITIGKYAPDFELVDTEGNARKLSDFRRKAVILNFWASWCPPCRQEMPEFQKIYDKGDIVVIGVNLQEDRENVVKFAQKNSLSFPLLLDPEGKAKALYNVFTQPVTYFIDKDGRITDKKFGALTSEEINEKINSLAFQEEITQESIEGVKTLEDGTKYIIHPDKLLSGGPPKDGIPSIDNPKFVSAEEANWLPENELGLGIVHKEEKRFYPFRILVYHEIVNDLIRDDAILVTYCPLCFTGIAFIREIDGKAVEFGVSGKLYNSELVLYDRITDSYWPQSLGMAVIGPSTGKKIKKIPTDIVLWGNWKKAYPETLVLSKDTGFSRSYDGNNPYGEKGNFQDINLRFPIESTSDLLPAYEIVYGIEIDGKSKAYQKSVIEEKRRIEDKLGGKDIVLEFDPGLKTARAKTGDGEEILVETLFWFAWYAFHPDTEIVWRVK